MKHSILSDFIVMTPEKLVTVERADSSLYERLDHTYRGFHQHELVACHRFSENWDSWEIHPHGDEVVMLMSGEVTVVLDLPEGHKRCSLSEAGDYLIVPANVWHTARTQIASSVLFITPGQGTQHKAGTD